MTAAEAERRRLGALAVESDDKNVVQIEMLYRNKWKRFEIGVNEIQHLSPLVLWDRYLVPALTAIDAPEPVLADPVDPEPSH